jgi:hypothetical protein
MCGLPREDMAVLAAGLLLCGWSSDALLTPKRRMAVPVVAGDLDGDDPHLCNVGRQPRQALAAAAADTHQQRIASGLAQDPVSSVCAICNALFACRHQNASALTRAPPPQLHLSLTSMISSGRKRADYSV